LPTGGFASSASQDKIFDHSVFGRARHERFRESDALRRVFEGVASRLGSLAAQTPEVPTQIAMSSHAGESAKGCRGNPI
jgi:hypothetical protein